MLSKLYQATFFGTQSEVTVIYMFERWYRDKCSQFWSKILAGIKWVVNLKICF